MCASEVLLPGRNPSWLSLRTLLFMQYGSNLLFSIIYYSEEEFRYA